VQINPRIGLDFAAVLRTALRQDPDIVFVGEMRDRDTVQMGLRAAMTGHLVFSTLHTINAVTAVHRLLDMGAEGFLIGSALNGVLAQRLIRRNCDSCSQLAELTPQQRVWLASYATAGIDEHSEFYQGAGCTYCNMTGYSGRIGIYELLEIDAGLAEFSSLARKQKGFVPLVERALGYVADRTTSIEEVMRVTAGLEERELAPALVDDVLSSEDRLQGSA
jgi:MSHA biogenesis protein MshE